MDAFFVSAQFSISCLNASHFSANTGCPSQPFQHQLPELSLVDKDKRLTATLNPSINDEQAPVLLSMTTMTISVAL